jgi:hypothetical protein
LVPCPAARAGLSDVGVVSHCQVSLGLSSLRDRAIVLVTRDGSPHIPSRVTAHDEREQLCRWWQTRIYRLRIPHRRVHSNQRLVPLRCCLHSSRHPRFRASWTNQEGSQVADRNSDRTTGRSFLGLLLSGLTCHCLCRHHSSVVRDFPQRGVASPVRLAVASAFAPPGEADVMVRRAGRPPFVEPEPRSNRADPRSAPPLRQETSLSWG